MTTTHAEPSTPAAGLDVGADPWIPVTMVDGTRGVYGLRGLLADAHRIESLAVGAPPAECALLRILYALGLRVSGLDEMDGVGRYDLLEQGQFDVGEVDAYFARYSGRFGLFDPVRPWMQEPRLPSQMDVVVAKGRRAGQIDRKTSGIGKLAVTRASASSSAWFGAFHDGVPVPVPGVEAVGHLLTWLWYGQGGPQGPVRRTPAHTGRHASVGPLRGLVSYHPTGRTLFETIVLGIPDTELVDRDADVAPWEADELPDPGGELPVAAGPVSLLTGRAQHALLLVPNVAWSAAEDVYIAWAWPGALPPVMDPYLNWLEGSKGQRYAQRAQVGRSLFRDLDGLILHRRPGSKQRRPLVMDAIHDVPAEVLEHVGVAAYGFEQEREKAGGEKGWYRAVTPAVLRLIREEEAANAGRLAVARERAEVCANRLAWAVDEVWKETAVPAGDPEKKEYASRSPLGERALAAYWPLAEVEFWLLVEQRAWDRAVAVFGQLAVSLYDRLSREITDAQQPRTVRAVVRHQGKVASMLPRTTEADTTTDGEAA
ncbi:type I-E CRISPR-associated protein Cse1/CasA [Streptomyces sp. NPDC093097]|uniref:type I-E CRISPR-associated protein Cse1/CasA n=1 Tax=Streptomyces sp. NPDC093097 TaxID=3366027 RepID=UPI00382802BA